MLRLLEPDSSQELHRIDGHRSALSAYETLTVDGAPIYQSPASNGGKSMNYTDIQGGETIEYTFNYDPGAKILHLYNTDSKGREVHTVYREYSEALPWDDGNADKTNNNTTK